MVIDVFNKLCSMYNSADVYSYDVAFIVSFSAGICISMFGCLVM